MWLPAHLPQRSDLVLPCHDIQIDIVSAYRPSIHAYKTCNITSVVVPRLHLPSCYQVSESRKFKSYGLLCCLLTSLSVMTTVIYYYYDYVMFSCPVLITHLTAPFLCHMVANFNSLYSCIAIRSWLYTEIQVSTGEMNLQQPHHTGVVTADMA